MIIIIIIVKTVFRLGNSEKFCFFKSLFHINLDGVCGKNREYHHFPKDLIK